MATYPTFTAPKRTAMTTAKAQTMAGSEINPLYSLAIQNVNSQLKQNQSSAVEQAAARGMGRSGLAQDALNKLTIGAQSDVAGLEAEKASKIATLARQLLERDQDVGFRENQQAFNVWTGEQNFRMQTDEFNYQKERDKVADSQWKQEFDYRKAQDAAAAARAAASGGGGGRSSGGSSRRSSSSGRRSSGSSSSYSAPASSSSNTSGYTVDQINWYSNPNNAPYAYGQKVNKPGVAQAPTTPKPIYTPSYAAALPKKPTLTGYSWAR